MTNKQQLLNRLGITSEGFENHCRTYTKITEMEAAYDRVASAHDTELGWDNDHWSDQLPTDEDYDIEDLLHETE